MQGPAALSFHCAASSCAKRGRVRHHPLPHRLPPLSVVCAALGQDADDAARPPRPTRPSAYVARICGDAAGVNLKCAAYARPLVNWYGTVYHGLPLNLYAGGCGDGGYLAYIGRICPEKRPDWAIEIVRRAGMPLTIAKKVDEVDRIYHEVRVRQLVEDTKVDFVGEIGDSE